MPVGKGEKHTFARFLLAKRVKKMCSCYMIEYGYDFWPKKKLDGGLSWNEHTLPG